MNKKNKKLAKKVRNKIIKSKTDDKIAKLKSNLNIENVVSIKRLRTVLIICFLILFLLIGRLFFLQIIDGSYLSSLATKQQTTSSEITSKRGNIYDSTGASLAISENVDTISINPSKIVGKTDEDTAKLKESIAKNPPTSNSDKKTSDSTCHSSSYDITDCITLTESLIIPGNEQNNTNGNLEENRIININTATKEQLDSLSGIGEVKAQAIIDYRSVNGNFTKIEDILNVDGIGDALFAKIKDFITV